MAYSCGDLAMLSLTVHESPRTYAPIVTQLVTHTVQLELAHLRLGAVPQLLAELGTR
jgi:hypothetical protein